MDNIYDDFERFDTKPKRFSEELKANEGMIDFAQDQVDYYEIMFSMHEILLAENILNHD